MSSEHSLLSVQESASSVDAQAASRCGGLESAAQCCQAEPLPKRQRLSGHGKRSSLAEGMVEDVAVA